MGRLTYVTHAVIMRKKKNTTKTKHQDLNLTFDIVYLRISLIKKHLLAQFDPA